jgi:hypothetical protein
MCRLLRKIVTVNDVNKPRVSSRAFSLCGRPISERVAPVSHSLLVIIRNVHTHHSEFLHNSGQQFCRVSGRGTFRVITQRNSPGCLQITHQHYPGKTLSRKIAHATWRVHAESQCSPEPLHLACLPKYIESKGVTCYLLEHIYPESCLTCP